MCHMSLSIAELQDALLNSTSQTHNYTILVLFLPHDLYLFKSLIVCNQFKGVTFYTEVGEGGGARERSIRGCKIIKKYSLLILTSYNTSIVINIYYFCLLLFSSISNGGKKKSEDVTPFADLDQK